MKPSTELVTHGQQPTHRRIFEGLRDQIKSGRYVPGTQLPGTRELAVTWQTSIFTVHTALRALAKEGWIDRRPNAGTYIADPRSRFLCAGIYHGSSKSTAFDRYLHFALLERLEGMSKTAQVFNDLRPGNKQSVLYPPLAEAIDQKRVQCVIAPSLTRDEANSLARLTLPTAFVANRFSKNTIDFNREQLFRESARQLAAQGCRSVGVLSSIPQPTAGEESTDPLHPLFHRAIERAGLSTRDEWIRQPLASQFDPGAHGYHEFKNLWSFPEKPDGLMVLDDSVAQGATIAILELGIGVVSSHMKFVFHRHAHLPYLCPFPVTWATSDEDQLAEGLMGLIEKQFAGSAVEPTHLDYTFSHGPSVLATV